MDLEEAITYLEKIDIKAKAYPNTEAPIRGGTRFTSLDDYEQMLVQDLFHIKRERHLWLVTIFMPNAHVIHASQELQQAVFAVENLYKLTQRQKDKYEEVTLKLIIMQYNGIVATVASSLDAPAILAICTDHEKVEDRYAFMLQHTHLATKSDPYRIYPYQEQWAIDSPILGDPSPLKIVADIEKASEFLVALCKQSDRNR